MEGVMMENVGEGSRVPGGAMSPRTKEFLRLRVNARERQRMHDMNSALDGLRRAMPYAQGPAVKKLSKMNTLLLARNYISLLTRSLEDLRRVVVEVQARQALPVSSSLEAAVRCYDLLYARHHQYTQDLLKSEQLDQPLAPHSTERDDDDGDDDDDDDIKYKSRATPYATSYRDVTNKKRKSTRLSHSKNISNPITSKPTTSPVTSQQTPSPNIHPLLPPLYPAPSHITSYPPPGLITTPLYPAPSLYAPQGLMTSPYIMTSHCTHRPLHSGQPCTCVHCVSTLLPHLTSPTLQAPPITVRGAER